MPVSASGRNGQPVGRATASVTSAIDDGDLHEEAHHLDRLEQHPVEVGRVEMVVAVLDRPVQLDAAAAELVIGGEVQQVFVDHPLHERLGREQRQRRKQIAPGPFADVDPGAPARARSRPAPRAARSAP